MHIKGILGIIGLFLMLFSFSHLPPLLVNYYYQDGEFLPFIISFVATFTTGIILYLLFRNNPKELTLRDGFLIVILFWLVLSAFGAIPFVLTDRPEHTITDAMFESVSGLTTTGASALKDTDDLPISIRYYRQQLQFLGGMGIIVLAIAILPILGVGGMQLYQAEMPGPLKESKLTPRITETAKLLWYIYVGLTVVCAAAYWLGGMPFLDAVGQSFATISTGGFSMHSDEFAYYNSPLLEMLAIFFMFLGGINFTLHFFAFRQKKLAAYWLDEECRTYFFILLLLSIFIAVILLWQGFYTDSGTALLHATFNVVSIVTTTGFLAGSTHDWPLFISMLVSLFALIGGCAASTSGGIKVIRWLLIIKEIRREIHRLLHPRAIISLKFGSQILPDRIVQAMWAFIGAFIALYILIVLLLTASGLTLEIAVGATTATLSNTGAMIGQLVPNFPELGAFSKWVLIFSMLAGRLEIFTLLLLFSTDFWRK